MTFSTSGTGPEGEEDASLAGSPTSSKKPSKPPGATMPRNLAGVVPAFLKVYRVPLGILVLVDVRRQSGVTRRGSRLPESKRPSRVLTGHLELVRVAQHPQ